MHEPVDQRDDAGGVGKDLAPFTERFVGRQNGGAVLIPASDDLEQKIGIARVVRQVPDLINAQNLGGRVAP